MTDLEKIEQWLALAIRQGNQQNLDSAQTWATIAQAEALLALCKRVDRIINKDNDALDVVVLR